MPVQFVVVARRPLSRILCGFCLCLFVVCPAFYAGFVRPLFIVPDFIRHFLCGRAMFIMPDIIRRLCIRAPSIVSARLR